MKKTIIALLAAILAVLAGMGWGYVGSYVNGLKNVDWGFIFQLLILWALPGLLSIIGIIWLVGFLFKISRKLDD